VRDFVNWLLKENGGWDRDRIDEVIRSGQRLDVRLTPAVNVYWVYVTAWASDNVVQFREDIYRRDGFGGGGAVVASGAPDGDLLPPLR
jgi:murein L,D-transpeptidase YcbB/YkuD